MLDVAPPVPRGPRPNRCGRRKIMQTRNARASCPTEPPRPARYGACAIWRACDTRPDRKGARNAETPQMSCSPRPPAGSNRNVAHVAAAMARSASRRGRCAPAPPTLSLPGNAPAAGMLSPTVSRTLPGVDGSIAAPLYAPSAPIPDFALFLRISRPSRVRFSHVGGENARFGVASRYRANAMLCAAETGRIRTIF